MSKSNRKIDVSLPTDHLSGLQDVIDGFIECPEDKIGRRLPVPKWVRDSEMYYLRRANYKRLLLETLSEYPDIVTEKVLCSMTVGFTWVKWKNYQFDRDSDLVKILQRRKAEVMLEIHNFCRESGDGKDRKWLYNLVTDEEEREILKNSSSKKESVFANITQNNLNITSDDYKKLNDIIDGNIVDVEVVKEENIEEYDD